MFKKIILSFALISIFGLKLVYSSSDYKELHRITKEKYDQQLTERYSKGFSSYHWLRDSGTCYGNELEYFTEKLEAILGLGDAMNFAKNPLEKYTKGYQKLIMETKDFICSKKKRRFDDAFWEKLPHKILRKLDRSGKFDENPLRPKVVEILGERILEKYEYKAWRCEA